MTRALIVALVLSVAAGPAAADGFGRHKDVRAFWLNNLGWSNPNPNADSQGQASKRTARKFTTTYVDGVARRFGAGTGHMDFFDRKLGGNGGFTPQLAGTVDGGGAKLVLRWHPGE